MISKINDFATRKFLQQKTIPKQNWF